MNMEINNISDNSIEIQSNGNLVNKDESVQITYYVQMIIQYSLDNVVQTSRSISGPYKCNSIPVSDFEIPHFINVFNINGVNTSLELKPSNSNELYRDCSLKPIIQCRRFSIGPLLQTRNLSIDDKMYSNTYTNIVYSVIDEGNGYTRVTIQSGTGTITFSKDTYVTFMIVGRGENGHNGSYIDRVEGSIQEYDTRAGGGGKGGQVIYHENILFSTGRSYNIGIGGTYEGIDSYLWNYIATGAFSNENNPPKKGPAAYQYCDANKPEDEIDIREYPDPPVDGRKVTIGGITYQCGASGGYGSVSSRNNIYGIANYKIDYSYANGGDGGGGRGGKSVVGYDSDGKDNLDHYHKAGSGSLNTGSGGGGGDAASGKGGAASFIETDTRTIIPDKPDHAGIGGQGGTGVCVLYFKT